MKIWNIVIIQYPSLAYSKYCRLFHWGRPMRDIISPTALSMHHPYLFFEDPSLSEEHFHNSNFHSCSDSPLPSHSHHSHSPCCLSREMLNERHPLDLEGDRDPKNGNIENTFCEPKEASRDKTDYLTVRVMRRRIQKISKKAKPKRRRAQLDSLKKDIPSGRIKEKEISSEVDSELEISRGENSGPNKRTKYSILTRQMKEFLVKQAGELGVAEVSRMYNVSINNLSRWRKCCDRRAGAGRKVNNLQMEQALIAWLKEQKVRCSVLPTRKSIQTKAKELSTQPSFKASKGWFERFSKRNITLFEIKPSELPFEHCKEKNDHQSDWENMQMGIYFEDERQVYSHEESGQ